MLKQSQFPIINQMIVGNNDCLNNRKQIKMKGVKTSENKIVL